MKDLNEKEIKDIELLLKPKAEFHASSGLSERIITKAQKEPKPVRLVRLLPWIAAACVVGVLFALLLPQRQSSPIAEIEKPQQKAFVLPTKEEKASSTTPEVAPQPTIINGKALAATTDKAIKPKAKPIKKAETKQEAEPDDIMTNEETEQYQHPMMTNRCNLPDMLCQLSPSVERQVRALQQECERQILAEEHERGKVEIMEL